MNLLKLIAYSLLSLSMALSLAACGQKSADDGAATDAVQEASDAGSSMLDSAAEGASDAAAATGDALDSTDEMAADAAEEAAAMDAISAPAAPSTEDAATDSAQ